MEEMSQEEYFKIIKDWKLKHEEEIENDKIRKVFLGILPRFKSGKSNKINWAKSIHYKVYFIYDNLEGYIEILKYNKDSRKLLLKYEKEEIKLKTSDFIKYRIASIIGKRTSNFKIEINTIFKDEKEI